MGIYLAAAIAYVFAFHLGLWSVASTDRVTPVWLSSGLAIWLVCRFGPRLLLVVFFGAIFANWYGTGLGKLQYEWAVLILLAGADAIAAFAGAWLWQRAVERWQGWLAEFWDVGVFLFIAAVSPMISASIGTVVLVLAGRDGSATLANNWQVWWAGDALGILYTLPLLSMVPPSFRLASARVPSWRVGVRAAVLLILFLVVGWQLFGDEHQLGFVFLVFPLLLLTTVWFGAWMTRLAVVLVAVSCLYAAANNQGPFVIGHDAQSGHQVQMILAAIAMAGLLLPAYHQRLNLNRRRPRVLLLVGWLISGGLFFVGQKFDQQADGVDFALLAGNAQTKIKEQLIDYTNALRSGVGFLSHGAAVNRAEWAAFAGVMDLPGHYPGIGGIAVIYPVAPVQTERFLSGVRAGGAPDFVLHPVPGGTAMAGQPHYIVTYIEPEVGNATALGLDVATDPVRRRAAEAARDSGQPRITSRIQLVQDSLKRSGFLLFLPVYHAGLPVGTVAERRQALHAWVNAPVITGNFVRSALGALGGELRLHVFAGDQARIGNLIFSTEPAEQTLPEFALQTSFELAGQPFTVGWNRGPGFGSSHHSPLTWVALSLALLCLVLTGWILIQENFRKQAEAQIADRTRALQESEQRLSFALAAADIGDWNMDLRTNVACHSLRHDQGFGYQAAVAEWGYDTFLAHVLPADRDRVDACYQQAMAGQGDFDVEFRVRWPDGSLHWLWSKGRIFHDEAGKPYRVAGIQMDITERKEVKSVLQISLAEKEALLKEVHHRVKNNLQVITSLMRLQAARSGDAVSRAALTDMQGRIRSMALLHEYLYRVGNLAAVDLGLYLRQLANQSFRALVTTSGQIRLELDLASISASMDQALPCGLILNELLSNSLKHAFPGDRTGVIRVELGLGAGGPMLQLRVSDNGVGLPADFAANQGGSLGLQLVSDLTQQLQGTLTIGPGANFMVTFRPEAVAPVLGLRPAAVREHNLT